MTAARITRPPKPAPEANGYHGQRPYRITVDQYHKMLESGSLTKRDRCVLIRGILAEKPTINPPHAIAVFQLTTALFKLLGFEAAVRIQMPITLPPDSEPQPDGVVALGYGKDYLTRHPKPQEIAIVVEVADSSVSVDRNAQLALYASHKLPVYWVINIPERRIEVYTDPKGGKSPTYRTRTDYGPDDAVPVVLAGKSLGSIPVRELLP